MFSVSMFLSMEVEVDLICTSPQWDISLLQGFLKVPIWWYQPRGPWRHWHHQDQMDCTFAQGGNWRTNSTWFCQHSRITAASVSQREVKWLLLLWEAAEMCIFLKCKVEEFPPGTVSHVSSSVTAVPCVAAVVWVWPLTGVTPKN